MPPPSEDEIKAAIVRAIALANSFGITSVHDANVQESMLASYSALEREHALNARVSLAIGIDLAMNDVAAGIDA